MIYKCPVCDGKGFVPAGFYNTNGQSWYSFNTSPEVCRSCNGKGVIKEDDINDSIKYPSY